MGPRRQPLLCVRRCARGSVSERRTGTPVPLVVLRLVLMTIPMLVIPILLLRMTILLRLLLIVPPCVVLPLVVSLVWRLVLRQDG